jgi:hypothetical protein
MPYTPPPPPPIKAFAEETPVTCGACGALSIRAANRADQLCVSCKFPKAQEKASVADIAVMDALFAKLAGEEADRATAKSVRVLGTTKEATEPKPEPTSKRPPRSFSLEDE